VRIPLSQPVLLGKEREYVLDCVDRCELSGGHDSYVKKFEKAFAEKVGSSYAVACCNGTAALHLALLAQGVQPKDEIFVPALTYVATANAVNFCGATPIFVDVDPNTWTMDPIDLNDKLKRAKRPVGILPVHLYGQVADLQNILDIASLHDLWVVEDAAEAHGATWREQMVGSFGEVGVFSFYGNKIFTTGEGGMLVTNNPEIADAARLYRGQGMDPDRRYWHSVIGYNYRMPALCAAIGLAQVEQWDILIAMRQLGWRVYIEMLASKLIIQEPLPDTVPAPWLFTVLLPKGVNRNVVMRELAEAGIETRPVFYPVTALPPYQQATPVITEEISSRGLSLPTGSHITANDAVFVSRELLRILSHHE
jgi:perosamine synthetase